MTITYDLTAQEISKFYVYHVTHFAYLRKRLRGIHWIILILLVALPLLLALQYHSAWWLFTLAVAILWLVFSARILSLLCRILLHIGGGMEHDPPGQRTIALRDDCIMETSPVGTRAYPYAVLREVTADAKNHLTYVYTSALTALVIPDAAFADENDKENFFAELAKNTNEKKGTQEM